MHDGRESSGTASLKGDRYLMNCPADLSPSGRGQLGGRGSGRGSGRGRGRGRSRIERTASNIWPYASPTLWKHVVRASQKDLLPGWDTM
jgi:hypothetical protein